jgi:thymidylate synthase ThyX
MIKAEVVADSLSPQGDRLISLLVTFPRIILAEVNTHRMLSKNTSSSRAIPFNKMVESVQNDPFIPIAWQKEHKGMQGSEYINDENDIWLAKANWLRARDYAIDYAKHNNEQVGVTKQLCNRLLEPFMWTTMLITGSREGWDNFFKLRCPQYHFPVDTHFRYKSKKDCIAAHSNPINLEIFEKFSTVDWLKINEGQAEIHMMALAESIWDSVNESKPKQLQTGEWHIPFENKINLQDWYNNNKRPTVAFWNELEGYEMDKYKVKVSTAMAAHTSYTVVSNEAVKDYSRWVELHDKLIAYDPPHSSPLEHCAKVMGYNEYYDYLKTNGEVIDYTLDGDNIYSERSFGWCGPYKGFMSYRYFIDNKINAFN